MDPILIDRELERAALTATTWLKGVEAEPEQSGASLQRFRLLLGTARFDEISKLPDYDPLRAPLLRCIFRYAEVRINHAWLTRAAFQMQSELHELTEPARDQFTLSAMRRAALSDAPLRREWADAWLTHGQQSTATQVGLWQRRQEITNRFGLDADTDPELPMDRDDLAAHAQGWLKTTQAMAEEFQREDFSEWLTLALGSDATEGWPAALNERSIAAWFRQSRLLEGLRIETPPMPTALGAASYMRALAALGFAVREAGSSKKQPFCVAHDPYGLESHAMATRFTCLLGAQVFIERNLKLSQGNIRDHQRSFARVLLLETRNRALKLLLRSPALEGEAELREAFPALVHQVLGAAVSDNALGVLLTPKIADAARYCGAFLGAADFQRFTETHDEDWFRNPRGVDELRSDIQRPPETTLTAEQLVAASELLHAQLSAWL